MFILYSITLFQAKKMKLFIAEKPSLGRAIAEHLPGPKRSADGYIQCGNDTIVTWCVGHVLELLPPEAYLSDTLKNEKTGKVSWEAMPLPIIPTDWKLSPKKETASQLRVIQKLIKDASSIVNAGDPDREGQLLVDEVLEYCGNKKPVQRIWLAALDETSVKRALASLKDNKEYANLKKAAESRQRADWLVGMNLTIAYTVAGKKGGYNGVLSVGRVQTPTLALIVKRDLEIQNFKPKDYFVVRGQFAHQNGTFWATWQPKDGTQGLDDEGRLLDKRVADAVAAKALRQPGKVIKAETKDGRQGPPQPFSLSGLQVAASSRYGLSAQTVLDICQALYEKHKLTSYPRTDCDFLPESQHADGKQVLATIAANNPQLAKLAQGANTGLKSKAWNDGKVTAHHAIIPTTKQMSVASLSDLEAKIYEMICKQYLAQFYPDRLFKDVKVEVECAQERFTAGGQTTTNPGWKVVFGGADEQEPEENAKGAQEPQQKLPLMANGDPAPNQNVTIDSKKTQPPKHFNDGTLIKAMTNIHQYVENPDIKKRLKETAGIGTEATRAAIIETILKRGFIEKKGKNLVSTPNGKAFIGCLPNEITDPGLTGMFEQSLAAIEEGRVAQEQFMGPMHKFVGGLVTRAKSASVSLPEAAAPYGGGKKSYGAKKSYGSSKPASSGSKPKARRG